MKTTASIPATVKIREEILQKFQPVNETLATNFLLTRAVGKAKQFGTVDMWKCHKQRRYYGVRIS